MLIVDDNSDIRDAIVALLESEGYPATGVADGAAALDYLDRADVPPSLIVLDLMMPTMDGVEFRERQLLDGRFAHIPVVIVSAYARQSAAASLGPVAYVPKPLDVEKLLAVVRANCAA